MARDRDPRIGMMIRGFQAILDSVPTDVQPVREDAPLTPDEVDQASAWMDRTAAEIRAERETHRKGV